MKATSIHIKNFMGIKEAHIEPGNINYIQGKNGTGKTSLIEAMKFLFKAKSNPFVIHEGSDRAEVVMEIDNAFEINRIQKSNKTDLNVKQSMIDGLVDHDSINPLDLLFVKPKERLEIVLSALPVELDPVEVQSISGEKVPFNGNPFEYIDNVRKVVYDKRTTVNVAKREKEGSLKQFRDMIASLNIPEDLDAKIKECDDKLKAINDKYNGTTLALSSKYREEEKQLNTAKAAEIREIEVKYQEMYDNMNGYFNRDKDLAQTEYNETFYAVKNDRNLLDKMSEQKGALAQTNANIHRFTEEVTKLAEDSEAKSAIINKIDEYKVKMVSHIPIKGLEIKDGDIFYNGIEFSKLNTATQILLAVDIAALKMGKFKLLFIDGAERLDADSLKVLEDKINEIGAQAFLGYVTNEDTFRVSDKIYVPKDPIDEAIEKLKEQQEVPVEMF